MAVFKDHRIDIKQLLSVIPEALLTHLSENTEVDYYSKILHGKKLFYLFMYGIFIINPYREDNRFITVILPPSSTRCRGRVISAVMC